MTFSYRVLQPSSMKLIQNSLVAIIIIMIGGWFLLIGMSPRRHPFHFSRVPSVQVSLESVTNLCSILLQNRLLTMTVSTANMKIPKSHIKNISLYMNGKMAKGFTLLIGSVSVPKTGLLELLSPTAVCSGLDCFLSMTVDVSWSYC